MSEPAAAAATAGTDALPDAATASVLDALAARLRAAGCVFAEEEAALLIEAAPDPASREPLVARRVAGEPLEQLLGWVAFAGLRLGVAPGVFVPRRRTELVARLAGSTAPRLLVELCCGVAPIATALAHTLPELRVVAADLDPAAVAAARANLAPFGERAAVHEGDLFAALPAELRGRVDVIAANAPYVPTDELPLMPHEAREHEDPLALDGGRDGLALHRRIADGASRWLAPGGQVVIETSERQADATREAFRRAGFMTRVVRDEELDATAVVAQRRPVSSLAC